MRGLSLGTITLAACIVMLVYAVYQIVNIILASPVDARVIGYEESDHYDSNTGPQTSLTPIYRYTWNGATQTYRSHYAIWLNWVKKDYNRIYISKGGKVFEREGVAFALVSALIFFLIV